MISNEQALSKLSKKLNISKTLAKKILQECFKKESMLLKDLRAYVALVETKGVDKDFANRILNEAKS